MRPDKISSSPLCHTLGPYFFKLPIGEMFLSAYMGWKGDENSNELICLFQQSSQVYNLMVITLLSFIDLII